MVRCYEEVRRVARSAIAVITATAFSACARANPPASTTPTSKPAAIDPSAHVTDVLSKVEPPAAATKLSDFEPDLPAVDGPFKCTGRDAHLALAPNLISLSAAFPMEGELRATVVLLIDSTGNLRHIAERRGPAIRPAIPPGTPPAAVGALIAAAADSARSTILNLDVVTGRASVANRGAGRPNQSVSAPIGVIESMEKFGKPVDRARRVLAQCNVKP